MPLNESRTVLENPKKIRLSRMCTMKHTSFVLTAVFLPGYKLASCSDAQTVQVWDLDNGHLLMNLVNSHDVSALAALKSGHVVCGLRVGLINIWDCEEKKLIKSMKTTASVVKSLIVLKNGNLVSCLVDGTIDIWNTSLDGHAVLIKQIKLLDFGVVFSPLGVRSNGDLVICSFDHEDSILRSYRRQDETVVSMSTGLSWVKSLLVLHDDTVLLGNVDGFARIYDLAKSEPLATMNLCDKGLRASNMIQLPNRYLMACGEQSLGLWDPTRGKLVGTIPSGTTGNICAIYLSPDGKYLAASMADFSIKIWSLSF